MDRSKTNLPGGHRERVPPDPIPNSEVKTFIADGSVGLPHVRVGHRQAFNLWNPKKIQNNILKTFFCNMAERSALFQLIFALTAWQLKIFSLNYQFRLKK